MRILNQFYFSQLSINLLWNYLTKADPISMIIPHIYNIFFFLGEIIYVLIGLDSYRLDICLGLLRSGGKNVKSTHFSM